MLRAVSAAIKPEGGHDLGDARNRHAMWSGRRDETGSRQHPAFRGPMTARERKFEAAIADDVVRSSMISNHFQEGIPPPMGVSL